MADLIILRGNSGSGKSTLACRLQQTFGRNTMIIAQDTVRREMLWVRDGPDSPALPLMIHLLEYGYHHSPIVILEGILDAACYRPLFCFALELFGASRIHAFYYDLPFEETLARHQTKPNRLTFGKEAMRRWWHEKDFIGFIPETRFDASVTLDEALERVCACVRSNT